MPGCQYKIGQLLSYTYMYTCKSYPCKSMDDCASFTETFTVWIRSTVVTVYRFYIKKNKIHTLRTLFHDLSHWGTLITAQSKVLMYKEMNHPGRLTWGVLKGYWSQYSRIIIIQRGISQVESTFNFLTELSLRSST